MKKALLVAEAGVNHQGSVSHAKTLIDMAEKCDADYVKFQVRQPELQVSDELRDVMRDTPFGMMSHLAYRERMEFGDDEYDEISKHCKQAGIKWGVSVWDIPSVDRMLRYADEFDWIKIPSAKADDLELIDHVRKTGLPMVLSTGMTEYDEIRHSYAHLSRATGGSLFVCHSAYPAPDNELNLAQIGTFKRDFPGTPIGYSSHSVSPYPAVYAAVLGARAVEVHITTDRSLKGSDHAASLEERGLELLSRELKRIPEVMGDGVHRVWESELPHRKRLRGY